MQSYGAGLRSGDHTIVFFDLETTGFVIPPLIINGDCVQTAPFLGVYMEEGLTWNVNTSELLKKAQQRLYFLRVLRGNNINIRRTADTSACDITQLSATSGASSFNRYLLPRCSISDGASRVTGLTVRDHRLLHHGRPVDTVPLREALRSFISFLRSFRQPLLVAHNARLFDCPILARALKECSLRQEFLQETAGFLDTWLICKELFDLDKYSQEYLVSLFLLKSYEAHNALEDVKALQELYLKWSPSQEVVRRHTFPLQHVP